MQIPSLSITPAATRSPVAAVPGDVPVFVGFAGVLALMRGQAVPPGDPVDQPPAGAESVPTDQVDSEGTATDVTGLTDPAGDAEDASDLADMGEDGPLFAEATAAETAEAEDPPAAREAVQVPGVPLAAGPSEAADAAPAAGVPGLTAQVPDAPVAEGRAAGTSERVTAVAAFAGGAGIVAARLQTALAGAMPIARPGQPGAIPAPGAVSQASTDGASLRRALSETTVSAPNPPAVAQPPVAVSPTVPAPSQAAFALSLVADAAIPADEIALARGEAMMGPAAATEAAASGRPTATEAAQIPQTAPRALALQIATALGRASEGSIDLALHPRELGRLRLSLAPTEQGLVVTVTADRPETLDLMRRHAAELGQDLRAMGFRDVDLNFSGTGPDHFRGQAAPAGRDDTRIPDGSPPVADPGPSRPVAAVQAVRVSGLDIRL